MTNLIDVDNKFNEICYSKRKHKWFFISATILTILLIVVLMSTSKSNYIFNMILTIIISVVYLLYLVFYFSVLRAKITDEIRLFSNLNRKQYNQEKCKFLSYENKKEINNGIEFFVLDMDVLENLEDTSKKFYVLEKFPFKPNKKYIINCFGKIIISCEEIK